MPIFEFHCDGCGHEFEELIRGSEQPACPRCGVSKVSRLLSAPAAPVIGASLPMAGGCPPAGSPPCHPGCCRLG